MGISIYNSKVIYSIYKRDTCILNQLRPNYFIGSHPKSSVRMAWTKCANRVFFGSVAAGIERQEKKQGWISFLIFFVSFFYQKKNEKHSIDLNHPFNLKNSCKTALRLLKWI